MSRNPTMADVARAAQVHASTVSLALRNDPRLPMETRERIRKLARAMEYRPNPMVSALIAGRRKSTEQQRGATLAFLTAFGQKEGWRKSPNYQALYDYLRYYADLRGYRLEEFWLQEAGMSAERLRDILLARGMHGIVVAPLPGQNHSLEFDFSDFAAIALGQTLKSPAIDHVSVNYFDIVSVAIQQLRTMRYRKIGFVTTRHIDERVNHHSQAAYLVACQAQIPHRPYAFVVEGLTEANLWRWYQRHRPEAILLSTRTEFKIAQKTFAANGIAIPGTVSLVNLDKAVDGKESGVTQNLEQTAAATIDRLTSRLERAQFGLPQYPQSVMVPGVWQSGWTTRAPQI